MVHILILFPLQSYFNSSEGYGNPLSFKSIDREKITEIESQMQQNGIAIERELDKSMDMDCEIHNDNLVAIFGEHFANNPSQFRFRNGDVILIEELVDRVKQMVNGNELHRFKYEIKPSKPSKRKKSKRKNYEPNRMVQEECLQDIGLLMNNRQIAKLKKMLFERVKTCFEQYSIHEYVEIGSIDLFEDQSVIDVHVHNKNNIVQIYGTVFCLICREQNERVKPLRVYYRKSNASSSFWVISNYTKHLKNTHHLKSISINEHKNSVELDNSLKNTTVNGDSESHIAPEESSENLSIKLSLDSDSESQITPEESIEDVSGNVSLNGESESCVALGDSIEIVSVENLDVVIHKENWLYTQFADQITIMVQAGLSNGEQNDRMRIKITKDAAAYVTVTPTLANGNCLFSAVAHQLYQHPINSIDHTDAINKLRADVVKHILDPANFPSYEFALKDRVYNVKSADQIENMTTECKLFVRHVLAKNGQWGGNESIKAISEIHKVNILVFYEDEMCVLQTNANEKYDKAIAIAFRIGFDMNGIEVRNHYESVCDMNSADIWNVTDLALNR